MAREASGGLPDPPTTLLALGDIRTGSPEPPIARNPPEPFRNHQKDYFYGHVNYRDIQDELCEADHVGCPLKPVADILEIRTVDVCRS